MGNKFQLSLQIYNDEVYTCNQTLEENKCAKCGDCPACGGGSSACRNLKSCDFLANFQNLHVDGFTKQQLIEQERAKCCENGYCGVSMASKAFNINEGVKYSMNIKTHE